MLGLKPDEQIRTPMQWTGESNAGFSSGTPWEPVNADHPRVNVAAQTNDSTSLLSAYRELISLRNQHAALRVGDFYPLEAQDPAIFASLRVSRREMLLVAVNLGSEAVNDPVLSLSGGPLSGSYGVLPATAQPSDPPPLVANANGGFDGYRPSLPIPAFGLLLLQLRAAP
jgi:glycosidase